MTSQPQSQISIQMFTDKMILSSAKNHKDILLWAENSGTVAFTYTDENMRTFVPTNKIKVIDKNLYSEFFIYLHENKSLFTVWNTGSTKFHSKFSVSDDRVSSIDISYDGTLLLVGTVSGGLYLYNLMTGILLKSVKISKNELLSVKLYKSFIIILDKEKLCTYLLGNVMQGTNDVMPKDLFVYYNNGNAILDNFIIENDTGFLYNKSNIVMINLTNLTPIKIFNIENQEVNDLHVLYGDNNLYFTNRKNDIFMIKTANYPNKDTHHIKITRDNSVLLRPEVKNPPANITVFSFGSKGKMITGHEDGKIYIWGKKTVDAPLYSYENMYNLHKGAITNILLINKPISQYGLNFNKKINECLISEKQAKELKEINIRPNEKFDDFIGNYLDEVNEEIMNEGIIDILLQKEDNSNMEVEIEEIKTNTVILKKKKSKK